MLQATHDLQIPSTSLGKTNSCNSDDSHAQSCSVIVANVPSKLCCIVPMQKFATHDIKSCSEMQGMQRLAAGGTHSGSHMTIHTSDGSTAGLGNTAWPNVYGTHCILCKGLSPCLAQLMCVVQLQVKHELERL